MTVKAMKSGAVEFLTKPFRDQDLLDAIQLGLERDRTRRQCAAETARLRDRLESLTPREREVLPFLVSGLLNKQIAAELGTSEAAIKVRRSQLMRKMGADSLPQLVRIAEKMGIHPAKPQWRPNAFTKVKAFLPMHTSFNRPYTFKLDNSYPPVK